MPNQLPLAGEQDLRRKLKQTSIVVTVLLVVGILCVICKVGWKDIGGALLWSLASLSSGAIGGFLFAVPRVPHSDRTVGSSEKTDTGSKVAISSTLLDERGFGLGINTNLEDISDWLTKMLVGIGLVELRSIPSYVVRVGHFVGLGGSSGADSTGASLVIYFAGLGFLTSYLLTRMFIGPAFLLADLATNSGVAYDAARAAIAISNVNADVIDALQALGAKDTHLPARTDELIKKLNSYRVQFPLNRRLHIVLGRLYREGREDFATAIQVLSQFAERKREANQIDIDLSDALFNIACYNSLRMKGMGEATTQKAYEEQADLAIRESIHISPDNLKDFYEDEDLESFRNSDSGKRFEAEYGPKG